MLLRVETAETDNVIMIGDKLLVKPKSPDVKRRSGLYLPPGIEEKQKIQQGYVIKTGPGYPIPNIGDTDETWKTDAGQKFIELQAAKGDIAVFMSDAAFEIMFNENKYYIVPQTAVLMLIRDNETV